MEDWVIVHYSATGCHKYPTASSLSNGLGPISPKWDWDIIIFFTVGEIHLKCKNVSNLQWMKCNYFFLVKNFYCNPTVTEIDSSQYIKNLELGSILQTIDFFKILHLIFIYIHADSIKKNYFIILTSFLLQS